jgi:hypothetical protein
LALATAAASFCEHACDMASADDQRITVEPFEEQLKVPQGRALQALDTLTRATSALRWIRTKRSPNSSSNALSGSSSSTSPTFVAQGHVLVVGDKVDHLIDRESARCLCGYAR